MYVLLDSSGSFYLRDKSMTPRLKDAASCTYYDAIDLAVSILRDAHINKTRKPHMMIVNLKTSECELQINDWKEWKSL